MLSADSKLLRFARRATVTLAALLSVLAALLFGLEQSGWLREQAEQRLRALLGPDARIASVRLDWFAPAVEIEGVELGDESGSLELERVRVRLAGFTALRAERIDVDGGRLRLSDQLVERVQALAARPGADGSESDSGAAPPSVVVERLALSYLHPVWGEIEVGRVDALSRAVGASARIEGRVTPGFTNTRGAASAQIFLAGERDPQGVYEIVAACAGLPVDASALPVSLRDSELARTRPKARLEFELSARFRLDESAPAEGSLRARLEDGSLLPPLSALAVEGVNVEVDARCATRNVAELLDPRAWRTLAHAQARWGASPLEAWALVGANAGEGLAARAWLHAPRFPLGESFWREVGLFEHIETNWRPLEPRGAVNLVVGARWKATTSFTDSYVAQRPELVVDAQLEGELGATYHGWPNSSTGRPEGFPAPIEQLRGRALVVRDPDSDHAALLALLEVLGAHSGGARAEQPAFIEGLVRFEHPPQPGAPRRYPALDLEIGTHGFPVDERMRSALLSLLPDDLVWREFGPHGGHVSAIVRLHRPPGAYMPSGHILIDLFGVDGVWRPYGAEKGAPELAVRGIRGRVDITTDPRIAAGVRFDLQGDAAQRARIRVRGRTQDDPELPYEPERWQSRRIQELAVEAQSVGLGGADRRLLANLWPQITRELERREASGFADARYRSATERAGGPLAWSVEATPRGAELTPEEFRVPIRSVRGRVLVHGADALGSDELVRSPVVRLTPLMGDTLGGASVACSATIAADGPAHIEVLAAGVAPSNPGIVGAFKSAFESTARGGQSGLSLSALAVDGRVDLSGSIVTSPRTPARPVTSFFVRLRENDVQTQLPHGRFELDRLSGVLTSRGDELRGTRLRAALAGAPIELSNARFAERGGAAVLETDFAASNFTLDREHLSMFLDPATVAVLLDKRGLRGAVDIAQARLELVGAADREGSVEFSGEITPRGLQLDLGLPLAIDSGMVRVEELRYAQGAVSARASLENIRGRIAERELGPSRIELEYDDPTLTVRDVLGEFVGGRLTRLDPRGELPAFQLELRDPFAFRLGLALERSDVGALLAGLFESDFATRGRMSARVELSGDLSRMSDIRGQGRVSLSDSNLWSVPVVRDLVSQFGLEAKSALFDSIQSRFSVENGEVRMSELEIASPYFGVSGSGVLDFDGSLRHEFEVRNRVVNLLGPIKNVLYRVAIRGDMSRPRVETYGVLGATFSEPKRGRRELPLPALTPLPSRF